MFAIKNRVLLIFSLFTKTGKKSCYTMVNGEIFFTEYFNDVTPFQT